MYDVIYDKFVDAKVAVYCELYFTDFYGNPTNEANKYDQRRQKCIDWISCPSPPATSSPSDAEDNDCSIDEAEVEAGVVDALISLGDGGTVELQEEMVGEEDEYGWAPEQAEA